ncbi:MAG: hypothetical protein H6740_10615 [Alphaproteobacteria bacterium]|nr:hypothetical protein [Alphaproteobacteria bacterium]
MRLVLALLALSPVALAEPGGRVQLSGVATHTGSGALRLEVLLLDEEGGAPLLVSEAQLSGPGPFAVHVPAGLGRVRLRVAHDPDGDGVGPGDAQGLSEPLLVGVTDIEGLVIELRRPDLAPSP